VKTKQLLLCALFAALTAAGVFIRIPFGVMVITLQTFVVFLSGLLLAPKYALVSQLVYMAIGLLGIPVFSKGGGLGYIFEPSFGFIPGFALCALLVSLLIRKKLTEPVSAIFVLRTAAYMLLSVAALYVIGITYMYMILNLYLGSSVPLDHVIFFYNAPFFLIDIIKFIPALLLGRAVLTRLPDSFR